jgi:uroporphyrinogen-III decarboxylase
VARRAVELLRDAAEDNRLRIAPNEFNWLENMLESLDELPDCEEEFISQQIALADSSKFFQPNTDCSVRSPQTMDRQYYLDLAASGLRMPIGTHLVLHEHADHADIILNGKRLGAVVAETADRFGTPLAVPLMDLTLEKQAMLLALGVHEGQVESYHLSMPIQDRPEFIPTPRMRATCDAISEVSANLYILPIGMGIGPFSLMTKLLADPITPINLAGDGETADSDSEVAIAVSAVEAGTSFLLDYFTAQIDAGAKAIIVCEPDANLVYFSPNQLNESFDTFDYFVTSPMRRIKELFDSQGVDLIFHDCGELTDGMVERFATLDPALLSLGCSRQLWKDAALVSKRTVLFGNLPTKSFVSAQLTAGEVKRVSQELLENMYAAEHPFILGSECDVLSVPGFEREIMSKVEAFMHRS